MCLLCLTTDIASHMRWPSIQGLQTTPTYGPVQNVSPSCADDDVASTSFSVPNPPVKRRRASTAVADSAVQQSVEIQRELLDVERKRLAVDQERLEVEKLRLGVERDMLASLRQYMSSSSLDRRPCLIHAASARSAEQPRIPSVLRRRPVTDFFHSCHK